MSRTRVRAGVLEQGTVDLMDDLGAGERLHREGMPDPRLDHPLQRRHHPYRPAGADAGQDRHRVRPAGGGEGPDRGAAVTRRPASCSRPRRRISKGSTATRPTIHFTHEGENKTLECDIVAGCDGFHGICRGAIPEHLLTRLRPRLSVRLARHPRGGQAVSRDDLFQPASAAFRWRAAARRSCLGSMCSAVPMTTLAGLAGPPHLGRVAHPAL